MKRLLISILLLACAAVAPARDVYAAPETWCLSHYACQGTIKKFAAIWHTHPSSGFPFKHLLKSPLVGEHSFPDVDDWIPHSSASPWWQAWDKMVINLNTQRWYFFNDCNVNPWCWNCGQCREEAFALYVPLVNTFPMPCEIP
jgi:hypothetical protein